MSDLAKYAERLLCKIGIHSNIFKDSDQLSHRMMQISSDLEEAFEKHYDLPSKGVIATFKECGHCGRVRIEIFGKVK